ncbi:preprotein translocase subunit YajC [Pseudonocardia bannensis]|uniref:Preprotein translocase subunit YajC n=1 Tax=Pseudonocardia bannensis TaxID=630973 RepID=A0A848DNK4_9PSEU|nr:preprotein translocase subunit YajC [Pseudonocardia bannensis]
MLFPLLILLLFIPIFLSGRKQRRQMAEMQQLQAALEPGDVVMTTSGLRGTVVDASYEDTVDLEIADGVVTTWVRAAVREKIDPTPDDVSSLTDEDGPGETAAVNPTATDKAPESSATADGEAGSNGRPDSRP